MAIGEAAEAEMPALLDLWIEAWAASMPQIDFAERRGWFADHLETLRRCGSLVLVARDQTARPLGFLTVNPLTRLLDQLAVAPASQQSGLGTMLVDEAKLRSPDGLDLSVNTVNSKAIAFYERQGFVLTGAGTNERSGLPIRFMRWRP